MKNESIHATKKNCLCIKIVAMCFCLLLLLCSLLSCDSLGDERETEHVHQYGDWIVSDTFKYRVCQCGAEERINLDNSGDNANQESVIKVYNKFDFFVKDCAVDGNTYKYSGSSKYLEVHLAAGDYSCNNVDIVIPNYVNDITFVGETYGNAYSDLQFKILNRNTELNVTFKNVCVQNNSKPILLSESARAPININVIGNENKFEIVGVPSEARGADNYNIGLSAYDTPDNGATGYSTWVIGDNCKIYVKASYLSIVGGKGGKGGHGVNAGNVVWCDGGNGGNGGPGGVAIETTGNVIVYVSADSICNIVGGQGGDGGDAGKGKSSILVSCHDGQVGLQGAVGQPGCQIINE